MGVDYGAVGGIGIYITESEMLKLFEDAVISQFQVDFKRDVEAGDYDEDDWSDWLLDCDQEVNEFLKYEFESGYDIEEYGNFYSGDTNFVITIRNPFEEGLDGFNEKYKEFEKFLKNSNMDNPIQVVVEGTVS